MLLPAAHHRHREGPSSLGALGKDPLKPPLALLGGGEDKAGPGVLHLQGFQAHLAGQDGPGLIQGDVAPDDVVLRVVVAPTQGQVLGRAPPGSCLRDVHGFTSHQGRARPAARASSLVWKRMGTP